MATGGYDSSVDSRVTCSICLEPYKGRQPKWLPCSHTFCLPCLTQIADKQATTFPKIVSGSDEDDRVVTITCPTCRTSVPLPPGGVAKLHNNIYVDGSDEVPGTPPPPSSPRPSTKPQRINCDLCEEGQGQEAKFTCSGCRSCLCTRCRRTHDRLCKSGQVTEIKVQAADDGDKETDVKGLASAVEKMIKRMSELEKTVTRQETLITGLQSHVTGLQNQNTMLSRDVTALHDKNTQLEKQSNQDRDAMVCLEKELISLKDKNAFLCQDNQELHNDFGKFQKKDTDVQDDISKVKNDVSKIDINIQSNIAKLQVQQDDMQAAHTVVAKEVLQLKEISDRTEKDIKVMKDKFSQRIGFHALTKDTVRFRDRDIIRCHKQIGGSYANGVFTAPISGMYCFLATSSPDSLNPETQCKIAIIVNHRVSGTFNKIAFLWADGYASSTAHSIVWMTAGDTAFIVGDGDGVAGGSGCTSFTGMLVQHDL